MRIKNLPFKKQRGAVLAVSLLLLLVLTLVAVTSMDGTNMSFKMSANNVYHDEAFNNSESTRVASTSVLYEYLKEGAWVDVNMPNGLAVFPGNGRLDEVNGDDEDRLDYGTLLPDLVFDDSGMTGQTSVLTGLTSLNDKGGSISQYKGYSGAGNSAGAAGGSYKFYEFRSVGTSKSNANARTASDYKYVQ